MSILRRIEGSRFSEVVPEWVDFVVVIVAGGPSLTSDQMRLVEVAHKEERIKCIAVNDAYLWAPWADVCYFADSQWWEWHTAGVDKPKLGLTAAQVRAAFADFHGQKCSIERSGSNITDDAVHMLRNKDFPNHGVGISLDPRALVTGRNSGFQAVNLAILSGSHRHALLGFDACRSADGDKHWHGEHPRPSTDEVFEAMRKAFSAAEASILATGTSILNCSPGSRLDNFLKVRLEEVLT